MENTSPIPISHPAVRDPWIVKAVLLVAAVAFAILFLLVPLLAVFFEAFQKGITGYLAASRSQHRCLPFSLPCWSLQLQSPPT